MTEEGQQGLRLRWPRRAEGTLAYGSELDTSTGACVSLALTWQHGVLHMAGMLVSIRGTGRGGATGEPPG